MNNSRILLLVDIDDSTATRKKKLKDPNVPDDFYFLLPQEFQEYDPLGFIYLFDDSIVLFENYYSRLPKDKEYFSVDLGKEIIIKAVNHFNVILFCKGFHSKDSRREFLQEICEMYPHVQLSENKNFDLEYDDENDIHSFEDFFQFYLKSLRAVEG